MYFDNLPTGGADEVMMMWTKWRGEFVALFPAMGHDGDNAGFFEGVYGAVDAGFVGRRTLLDEFYDAEGRGGVL